LREKSVGSNQWLGVYVGLLFFLLILPGYAFHSTALSATMPEYISEYPVPTPASAPLAITTDANGMVWFTESNASKLTRFDPGDQSFAEYRVPGVGDMWGVVRDRGGYLWLTQYSGKGSVSPGGSVVFGGTGRLIRFDPTQSNFTSIEIPTVGSFPMRLAVDDQNRIWFTELLGNKIGVYDQSKKQLTEYPVPTNTSGPADLTFDRRGTLWFTETYSKNLAEFFPLNQSFVEYPLGSASASQIVSSPVGLAIDNQGNVWVADHGGNWIVKFNSVTHGIVKYPTHFPPQDVYPISLVNDLLIDSAGRIWFAEHGGNSVGYLNTQDYSMIEFPIPTGPISTCLWLALAPNGDVWFTEWSSNKIGVVHSNITVPVSVLVSDTYLRLSPGDETTLSFATRTSENTIGNGTLRYSWSSYNPMDISVQFSPQYPSLAGPADTNAQAELFVSTTTKPGNYTLALGIETARAAVWRMVQVQVTAQAPSTSLGTTFTLFSMAAVILVAIVIVLALVLHGKREHRPAPSATPQKA
jgi:virginiamycin B lyase